MRRSSSALLLLHVRSVWALSLAVVSKVIVDSVSGVQRPGGGGVQAACGACLASFEGGSVKVGLHAPVGADFEYGLLAPLTAYGVDTSGIARLPNVPTTPGELITYEGEQMSFEKVGWDDWETLCEWEPSLESSHEALHVIVEGGGSGEVRSVLKACAEARDAGSQLPCIGVEPVAFDVDSKTVDGLCEVTRIAALCSPDLATAICMRDACASPDASVCRPADVDAAALAEVRSSNALLLELAATVYDELCMQPGACLAIRDGAHGSYLYTRPAPGAPMWQWLASGRDFEWLARVPAVSLERVADPTGAGNAYAGAFCSMLAAGADMVGAAAVATAVGAAFCRAAEAVPSEPDEVRRWVQTESVQVRDSVRVVQVHPAGADKAE